jgi:peptide/nickel transport system permease protein
MMRVRAIQAESRASQPDHAVPLVIRKLLGHYSLVIAIVILTAIILVALFAPLLVPYDPYNQDLSQHLIKPFWYASGSFSHPLGTDEYGRDYLSRLIYGARIPLMIGFLAMIMSGIIGTIIGVLGGYFSGRVDMVVSFLITVRLSMPVVLIALAVASLVGGSLQILVLILGFLLWDRYAVVTRSVMQQIKSLDYINAARAMGQSTSRIIFGEVLPNLASHIVVVGTLQFAHAVILAAALSFLGIGIQPPAASWGLMIAEGKRYMFFDSWMIMFPAIALFLLVLAVNMLGDGIRDLTAPEGND